MDMIDMKVPASSNSGAPVAPSSEYPYGLQLSLTDEVLKKLGVEYLPAVGSYYMVVARASVVSINESQREGEEKHKRLELQIEELALSEPTQEFDAATMYPNSKMEI